MFSIVHITSVLNLKEETILTLSEKNLLLSLKIFLKVFIFMTYFLIAVTFKCNLIYVFCNDDSNSVLLKVFKVQSLNLVESFLIILFTVYICNVLFTFNNGFVLNNFIKVSLKLKNYISGILIELWHTLSGVIKFIKTYHSVFSLVAVIILFHYDMQRSILLLLLFESKQFLIKLEFFQGIFNRLEVDTLTVQNHWKQDFDLIWCNRFLITIRLCGFFIICLTMFDILVKPLIPYLVTIFGFDHLSVTLVRFLLLNYKLGFLIIIVSFVVEFILNIQVIIYRNNPVEKPFAMIMAASWKFLTQTLPTVGSELAVEAQRLGSKFGETVYNNSQNIKYGATVLGIYEISKHPITKELMEKELDAPSSSTAINFAQETVYGVRILKPYEKNQLNILMEIFPDLKGKEFADLFAIDGRISESKIRDLYEKDPNFASKFKIHHLQHFGLGDKIEPDIARESNKKNIARRGLTNTKERGLYIDETAFPSPPEKQVVPGRPNSDFSVKPGDTENVKPNKMAFSSWAWGNKEQPPVK